MFPALEMEPIFGLDGLDGLWIGVHDPFHQLGLAGGKFIQLPAVEVPEVLEER